MKQGESTNFTVKLLCKAPLANQKLIFLVKVENGNPLAIEVNASFQGPKIKIVQPEANFGLLRAYTSKSIDLDIINLNDVPAELLIRRKGETVNFDEYRNPEEPFYQWWDNLITFDPQYFVMQPNEKKTIKLTLNALEAKTLEDLIEVLVWEGDTYTLFYRAEVQEAHFGLNRYQMVFPALYASKSYTIDAIHEQSLKFINFGNIPATFKWKTSFDPNFTYSFEPSEGVVPPKSEQAVTFKFKPDLGANVNRIFECHVNELPFPLGFEMQGSIYGLSVEYELFPENPDLSMTSGFSAVPSEKKAAMSATASEKKPISAAPSEKKQLSVTQGSEKAFSEKGVSEKKGSVSFAASDKKALQTGTDFNKTQSSYVKSKGKVEEQITTTKIPFEKLEMTDLKINEPRVMKFMLKNTSGLDTKFNFYCEIYEPLDYKTEESRVMKTQTGNNTSFDKSVASHTYSTSTKKKLDASMRQFQGPLVTADIEHLQNFTSFNGQMLNNKRKLEKDQKFYLTNNKGVAIVCEPHMGDLKAYQQITITLTIYNDVCGKFEVKVFIFTHLVGQPLL